MKNNPIITYEFATFYIEGQAHLEGETPLKERTFNNLWDFILSSKASSDSDAIMSVHTRGGRRYIKTSKFVGTLQTKDGQVIEILPKIYKSSGKLEEDKNVCRTVFLNMLRYLGRTKAKSFQNASLSTKKGFPILEVYISNYIHAVEELLLSGLRKNYSQVSESQRVLKGRLDISKQLRRNSTNKSVFSVVYNKYYENIPQNRIVVTTLRKLYNITRSVSNKSHITSLLIILSDIPSSINIEKDLSLSLESNRLFSRYESLILWSSQFLLNRGFTTFSGSYVNQSLLFQAEKLFEDFIAHLFKRYALKYKVHAQNTRYFLVDKHNGKKLFQLRPDLLVETEETSSNYECIIIDTKWKSIDSTKPEKRYLLDIKDMYQLYVYGQKYRLGETARKSSPITPKLVLLYPYSEKFTKELPEFIYEENEDNNGLKLYAVPFDLADFKSYDKQITRIIQLVK